MKKSVFIISKPLQYINATNIADDNLKDCIITNSFFNAQKFCDIVKENSNRWETIKFSKNTYTAVREVIKNKNEYEKLYIDSDFGIILSFYFYQLGSIQIYTYEEGYASYTFIRSSKTFIDRFKNNVANLIGLKNWVGSHSKTVGLYLYQPLKFIENIGLPKNKKLLSFEKPLSKHIYSLKEISILYENINFEIFKGKDVLLYMTNYYANPKIPNLITAYPNALKVIKPHPQMSVDDKLFSKFDQVIENQLPAEILIDKILGQCNRLTVVHEGSFALEYFKGDERVNEILLPNLI